MGFLAFIQKLLAIWAAISPFLVPANLAQAEAAFEQAISDAKTGNYQMVLADLVTALTSLIPAHAQTIKNAAA